MNIPNHRYWAILLTICTAAVSAAPTSKPTVSETPAAKAAQAERIEQAQKQQKIVEDKRMSADRQAVGTATVVDLPVDETDSPGAVSK
jgi:hemolysin activation/secretion protein